MKRLTHMALPYLLAAVSVLAPLMAAWAVSPRGIRLHKTGDSYEPKFLGNEMIVLSDGGLKAGVFLFVIEPSPKRLDFDEETGKAGIWDPEKKVLYYVERENYARQPFRGSWLAYGSNIDLGGDCGFGSYGEYITMDCWEFGSVSGHGRKMVLFRSGPDRGVELLDVIMSSGLDFASVVPNDAVNGKKADFRDFDGDGRLEIQLETDSMIRSAPEYDLSKFKFFIGVQDNKLRVNLNPELYKPLFAREESADEIARKRDLYNAKYRDFLVQEYATESSGGEAKFTPPESGAKWDAYYIYGFLSGRLQFADIEAAVRAAGELYPGQLETLMDTLRHMGEWDARLHNYYGDKPVLVRRDFSKDIARLKSRKK